MSLSAFEQAKTGARTAEAGKDWEAALAAWRSVQAQWPKAWEGHGGVLRALRALGEQAAAAAVLARAAPRFGRDPRFHADSARLAEDRRDWPAAEAAWRAFLALGPRESWACRGLAQALREQGRAGEAAAYLTEAAAAPEMPEAVRQAVRAELARLHEGVGDWAAADRIWQALCQAEPQSWPAQAGHLRALAEMAGVEQARAACEALEQRFAGQAGYWADRARLCARCQDWIAAEQGWRRFLRLGDPPWWGFAGLAGALREQSRTDDAVGVLTGAMRALGPSPALRGELARTLDRARRWGEAVAEWTALAEAEPAHWPAQAGAVRALGAMGRTGAAHAKLAALEQRFAGEAGYWQDRARLSERLWLWAEAERCWRAALAQGETDWWAEAGLAAALREQGHAEAAESVLDEAIGRHGALPELLAERAMVRERAGAPLQSRPLWQALLEAAPGFWPAHAGHARLLAEEDGPEASLQYMEAQEAAFSGSGIYWLDRARGAERLGEWAAAEAAWRRAAQTDPRLSWAEIFRARTLLRLERAVEGFAILARLRESFAGDPARLAELSDVLAGEPDPPALALLRAIEADLALLLDEGVAMAPDVMRAHAVIARALGEPERFLARAQAFLRAYPERVDARRLLHEAMESGGGDCVEAEPDMVAPLMAQSAPQARSLAALLLRCESLGGNIAEGDHNRGGCEFGFVQRHFGLEPIGLLRWVSLTAESLAAALENRFATLGEAGTLDLHAQHATDWRAVDLVYGMRFDHTHLARAAIGAEAAAALLGKRLALLRRKLIEDLQAGEKCFVFRHAGGRLGEAMALRLGAAMRAYGPGQLLLVDEDAALDRDFTIAPVAENVRLCTRRRFAPQAPLAPIVQSWAAVLEAAEGE